MSNNTLGADDMNNEGYHNFNKMSVSEAKEYAWQRSFEIKRDFAEYWNVCHWWQKLWIFIFHHDDYKLL